MGWISWIILGGVAGALAKWILPGSEPGGLIITIAIGIAGGLLGGYLGSALLGVSITGFNLVSLGLAVGGAMLLLLAYRVLFKRS